MNYWLQLLIGGINIPNLISSTAIIHPSVQFGKNVSVGPYSIIDHDVNIGNNTCIDSQVHIKPYTTMGKDCKIFHGAVIGEIPQDIKYCGEKSQLIIGDSTTIREFCTLNRGTKDTGKTIIGNHCLLMAYVHVAHDCIIGNHNIISNSVQMGGHVEIGHHVTIGGMTPIHQFCKVGDYSFIGGGYRIVQDVPPYIMAMNEPLQYSGLNVIGLRRHKFSSESRNNIKQAYKLLYHSTLNRSQALKQIKAELNSTSEINNILEFINKSTRGLI